MINLQKSRPIWAIADEIAASWKPRVHPYAAPYLNAMLEIENIGDMYGSDTAKSVVTYFLCNAQTWKGEDAKRIKKELNQLIK